MSNSNSDLEKLPTELIQHIFLYSCEINLARASPILASALTGRHLYKNFMDRVFGQIKCKGSSTCWSPMPSTDEDVDVLNDLRSRAMGCRWLTWDIFSKHQLTMARALYKVEHAAYNKDTPEKHIYLPDHTMTTPEQLIHEGRLGLFLGTEVDAIPILLRQPRKPGQFQFLRALIKAGRYIHDSTGAGITRYHQSRVHELWLRAVAQRDYRAVHLFARNCKWYRANPGIVRQAMDACDQDMVMLELMRCLTFGRDWERVRRVWGTWPVAQDLLEAHTRWQSKGIIMTEGELVIYLMAAYPQDGEWRHDAQRIVDVRR